MLSIIHSAPDGLKREQTMRGIKNSHPMKIRILGSICYVLFTIGGFADSYTITLTANQCSLIANQLDAPGGNTIGNLLAPPAIANNTQLIKYNGGFSAYTYSTDDGQWDPDPTVTLNPGEGAIITSPVATTITFTGTPHVPVLPLTLSDCRVYLLSCQTNTAPATFQDVTGLSPTNRT